VIAVFTSRYTLLTALDLTLIDLSSATEDYLLQPGYTAIINFSNTTTVPLHIATPADSYYELHIIPSNTGGINIVPDSRVFLYPNNQAYTNAFRLVQIWRNINVFSNSSDNAPGFRIAQAFSAASAWIINRTQYKNVRTIFNVYGTSTGWPALVLTSTDWRNTTTPWTSLGSVVFPQNASGTIIVRRLM
jgi:hypothetical protein